MVSTSSYVEQGGKQKGTIHVVRDTTDRRIAEEKYRLLFEQVQEGVFVATPEGKLLDCNDAFMRMLGHTSREELMGINVDTDLYASAEQRDVFPPTGRAEQLRPQLRSQLAPQGWHAAQRDGEQFRQPECGRQDRALPGLPARHDGEETRGR